MDQRPLHLIGVPESENLHETPPERKFPSFELLMGRKPIAGKDYSEEGDFCQDDAEYFSGSGRYSNDFNEVAQTAEEREALTEQILAVKIALDHDAAESARRQFPECFDETGEPFNTYVIGEPSPPVQSVPVPTSPTGGTFTITHGGKTSEPLKMNATPEEVQAAVQSVIPESLKDPEDLQEPCVKGCVLEPDHEGTCRDSSWNALYNLG
jgi:hypothetical protein